MALVTLLTVFKREVTFIKARSNGGGAGGGRLDQLDKEAVEEALRRQFDEEASLVFVPGEEWAGSVDTSEGKGVEQRADPGRASHTGGNVKKAIEKVEKVEKVEHVKKSVQEAPVKGRNDEKYSEIDDDYVRDMPVESSEKKLVDVDYADADTDDSDETSSEDYGAIPDDYEVAKSETSATARGSSQQHSQEVQLALQQLRACTSLECIGKAHEKLAGKTKFNAPHYFLIGFQKCATTSVNNYLRGHPEYGIRIAFDRTLRPTHLLSIADLVVCSLVRYMPSVLKEAHYFTACTKSWNDTNCKANSTQDYIDNYLRISDAVDNGLMAATVDASVDYAWKGEDLAREIHNVFPWLKIVVMMREPISRVISYTRMWTQKGVRTSTHKDNRIVRYWTRARPHSPNPPRALARSHIVLTHSFARHVTLKKVYSTACTHTLPPQPTLGTTRPRSRAG